MDNTGALTHLDRLLSDYQVYQQHIFTNSGLVSSRMYLSMRVTLSSNSVRGVFISGLQTLIYTVESESWYTINGELHTDKLFDELAGLYETKDNNYVRIHTNFPQ